MAKDRYSLFGMPSPSEYMQDIGRIDPADVSMANSGINAPAAVGISTRHLAKPIIGMLQGYTQKQKMKSVFDKAASANDPEAFYSSLVKGFKEIGQYDRAMQALELLRDAKQDTNVREANTAKANAAIMKAEADFLKAMDKIREPAYEREKLHQLQTRRRDLLTSIREEDTLLKRKELREVNTSIDTEIVKGSKVTNILPATSKDKIQAEIDSNVQATESITRMIAAVNKEKSNTGVVGTLKKGAQQLVGMTLDVADFLGADGKQIADDITNNASILADYDALENKDIEPGVVNWINNSLYDPKLSRIKVFENSIAYMVARSRKPGGRLNTDDIKRAHDDTKITGLTFSDDVATRLQYVLEELNRSNQLLQARKRGSTLQEYREAKQNAPAESSPPKHLLKEGKSITFANGQTWTLVNGQPKRVK